MRSCARGALPPQLEPLDFVVEVVGPRGLLRVGMAAEILDLEHIADM